MTFKNKIAIIIAILACSKNLTAPHVWETEIPPRFVYAHRRPMMIKYRHFVSLAFFNAKIVLAINSIAQAVHLIELDLINKVFVIVKMEEILVIQLGVILVI